ncbi:MAG: CoA pyrophosphatase [Pseudomonadota bacterium]
MTTAWQERLARGLATPASQRERFLFRELNPTLDHTPILTKPVERPRPAAVLIGIRKTDEPSVVLTVRSPTMPSHAGQISLPGGTPREEGEDHVATALREADEEVGLAADVLEVIGTMGPHHGGLGYVVTPVVALLDADAPVEACPREVSEAFEVPFAHLVEPKNHVVQERRFSGVPYNMFAVPVADTKGVERNIWGLTAGILSTLSEVYNDA